MDKPRILLIGTSHIQMVRAAHAGRDRPAGRDYTFESHWLRTKRHGETSVEDAIALIGELGPRDLLVLNRLGTLHNIVGLFEHDTPYVVFDPETGDRPGDDAKDAPPIPVNALRKHFAEQILDDNTMTALARGAPATAMHFGAPPPKRRFAKEGKFRDGPDGLVRMAFNDAATRLALWRIEHAAGVGRLAELGIRDCPVPAVCVDGAGHLDPAFGADDATHANAAYGALLLDRFELALFDEGALDPAGKRD